MTSGSRPSELHSPTCTSLISGSMLASQKQFQRPHLCPTQALGCVLQCLQVGVPRPRPSKFSACCCHFQSRQTLALHCSVSAFILAHSSSDMSSRGNFAWIIVVVSSPGGSLFASQHHLFRSTLSFFVCFEISWLTPLPPTPPLACGNSTVPSLLGVSRRRYGLAPAWLQPGADGQGPEVFSSPSPSPDPPPAKKIQWSCSHTATEGSAD